ncbi:type IX secretion system membrane protein PorP/SprF [Rhabdobacter roseus]|uniref:Type IX secretion system PorP/SprF family membrane protein n=1 Tax=Rhabdobacter roseus TaxID=1655419 RepID=A0A840TQ98_9BACT|nr:type IX secretion system membrane protein PorP/SprF [Rhabdobacter roseus]MBB5286001.1 type IX secretion system PorP/SprF family membrane protein [Rhabdobacter roseus]
MIINTKAKLKYLAGTCLLWLVLGGVVRAQQLPQSGLLALNPFVVNPAVSGAYDFTDVRLSYRRQWLGLEDAPHTAYVTAHLPIGYGDRLRPGAKSPRYAAQRAVAPAPPAGSWRFGGGVQLLTDQTGPTERTIGTLTGAAHLSLPARWQLSAGLGIGVLQYSLRFDRIQTTLPTDPILPGGRVSLWRPLLSAGILLRHDNLLLGASAQALNAPRLHYALPDGSTSSRLNPHYYLTGAYRLAVSDEVAILPQLWLKTDGRGPASLDTQLRVQYTDRLWAGAQYRAQESLGFLFGLALSPLLSLGYVYEYPLNGLRTATAGSHELMLGLRFNNRTRLYCAPLGW